MCDKPRSSRLVEHGPIPLPFSLPFFSFSSPFIALKMQGARVALASAISLTGYAPFVASCNVSPSGSQQDQSGSWGSSQRTNEAFRGCWPWYSLNCMLVLLCMRGPTRVACGANHFIARLYSLPRPKLSYHRRL